MEGRWKGMHIEELAQYKVVCYVDRKDLRMHGIQAEDLIDRTPLGRIFIGKAAQLAKESTEYDWPGCAFSMQIDVYPDRIGLVFSERLDDYLYNLEQSAAALDKEQADGLRALIAGISMAEEDDARRMVRKFENNVRTFDN